MVHAMKILVMSDLHNEIHQLIPLQVDVDVIVLAGDSICS